MVRRSGDEREVDSWGRWKDREGVV